MFLGFAKSTYFTINKPYLVNEKKFPQITSALSDFETMILNSAILIKDVEVNKKGVVS